jgi:hypothetical protein
MKGILWLSLQTESPVDSLYQPARHLHVTLQFGVEMSDFAHLIGQKVKVAAVANCCNDRIQAIRVNLPAQYKELCQNEVPHITISHLPDVRPVESNEMLKGEHTETPLNFEVETIVEFYQFK